MLRLFRSATLLLALSLLFLLDSYLNLIWQ